MSAPQIIRTASGEELVVLTRAEYEALLERADDEAEDADDVAIYDARKAELAAVRRMLLLLTSLLPAFDALDDRCLLPLGYNCVAMRLDASA